jgi:hypothetical protein
MIKSKRGKMAPGPQNSLTKESWYALSKDYADMWIEKVTNGYENWLDELTTDYNWQ